jgi:hypothetical protein
MTKLTETEKKEIHQATKQTLAAITKILDEDKKAAGK